jgi:uncharacterized membrane protein YfcA
MLPLAFYPLAILAVLLVGISKSGFGGGLGVLAVPLMSLIIAPPQAAAILLPLLICMDMMTVYHYRRTFHRRNLQILLPGALVGIGLGSLFFRFLSDAHIRILVGGIALVFVINYFFQNKNRPARPEANLSGLFWGAIAGFTSFGVHAGGPPVNIYLLPQKLDKTLFVGTTVIFFAVVNLAKVIPYALLGQFSPANLYTSLVLAPFAWLGVRTGVRLHHRINEQRFYLYCYIFLGVTGTKILFDGLAKLF